MECMSTRSQRVDQANSKRFRWVFCQMNILRESISPNDVKKALKSLQKSFDETYERILQSFPDNRSSDALRILQWLLFSARQLRIEEVAELLVSNPNMKNSEFNVERRPFNPKDIVTNCGSLVTVQISSDELRPWDTYKVLRLGHFSVQEFLVSDRILASRCAYDSVIRMALEGYVIVYGGGGIN